MNQWIQKVGVQCQSRLITVYSDARHQQRLTSGVNDENWEFWDAFDGKCGGLQAADHKWVLAPHSSHIPTPKNLDLWRTQPRFLGCFYASDHRTTWLSIGKSCLSHAVYVTVDMVLSGSEFNDFLMATSQNMLHWLFSSTFLESYFQDDVNPLSSFSELACRLCGVMFL